MRRVFTLIALAIGTLMFAATSAADPGEGRGEHSPKVAKAMKKAEKKAEKDKAKGEHGKKDGNDEADDENGRTTRTFTVVTTDNGSCGTPWATVSGGTFNPNATCTGPTCGFTDVFLTTFFGPNAQFSCNTNSTDCRFNFVYKSDAPDLTFRRWQDKGTGAGEFLREEFNGDIATA
jgi:hypothetical protein